MLALGAPCNETIAAVRAMLTAGVSLVGIIVPRHAPAGGALPSGVASLLGAHGIPLVTVARGRGAFAIGPFRPDVIVAACFPWRLPPAVLTLPTLGCLNIHPSLLPRGRGPDPVFWTVRRGERETGVTVHLMDAGFDTGPILGQHRIAVPIGARLPELEQSLMADGGELAARLLPDLAAGRIRPIPQDDALATAAPIPAADDYVIPTTRPAAWAYSFARGVAPRHGPLAVEVAATGKRLPVRDAVDYAGDDQLDAAVKDDGRGLVRVRFGPGWVRFMRAESGRYPLSLSPTRARDIR